MCAILGGGEEAAAAGKQQAALAADGRKKVGLAPAGWLRSENRAEMQLQKWWYTAFKGCIHENEMGQLRIQKSVETEQSMHGGTSVLKQ